MKTLRVDWPEVAKRMAQLDIRSIAALGREVGMDRQHIWELSRGHHDPKLSTVGRIAIALDCAPGDLLTYKEED